MRPVSTRCPAKVNLYLEVSPPDSSGCHPIRTEFQAVDLCDDLEVMVSDRSNIDCPGFQLPPDNTLAKTLRLLSEACDLPPLSIKLHKRIPTEAGLGGGSSDAAGLLRCLLKMGLCGLSDQLAFEVAGAVGKDAPFFLIGGRALGTGYGDTLQPMPDAELEWFCLCKPDAGAATAAAYAALDRARASLGARPPDMNVRNDFELVASKESLELIRALESLGAGQPMLTGSGSAVFGRFGALEAARQAEKAIRSEFDCWTHVAKSMSRRESLWTS